MEGGPLQAFSSPAVAAAGEEVPQQGVWTPRVVAAVVEGAQLPWLGKPVQLCMAEEAAGEEAPRQGV